MQKLFRLFKENISATAVDIMYYGSGLAFGLLLIGIFAHEANIFLWGNSYVNELWSIEILTSAMSLFVQSFFFALMFDCVRMSKR